ncbi:MAG TPA: extracellular solute-binding protein [Acidimicrobiales bacterium]
MARTRRWPALAVLTLALVVTGACGGSGSDETGEGPPSDQACPVDALDSASGPTEVVLWYQLNGKAAETLEKMVGQYNASQDRVRVRAELQGSSYDELLNAYEQAIPSGQLPDLLVAEDTATQFLIDSGTVLPAQSCFDADGLSTDGFVPAAVNHYSVDGALWPGSVSVSDLLTYYNANHLRRAGLDPADPPQTLDDVRAMAESIKAAGVTDTPVVLLMDSWLVETQLTGSKQSIVDNDNGYGDGETTEATFDTDTTRTVFDWIDSMTDEGLLLPVQATPGNFDHYFAMAAQKASITIETSVASTTIQEVLGGRAVAGAPGPDEIDRSGLDIAAAPVFGVDAAGKAQIGGNGFWMTTAGTDAEKAGTWDLIKWWNAEPQQVQWHVEGSYLPFLTAAAESPDIRAFWDTTLAGGFLRIAYEEFASGVDPDFSGALIGPYDEFRASMRDALASVAFQDGDPSTAIATARDETTEAITRYNDAEF